MQTEFFNEFAKEVLQRAEACYLSTVNDAGHPLVRAMVNLRNPALFPKQAQWINEHLPPFMLIYSTPAHSAKVQQLRTNPKASVLYAIPGTFKGLTFLGSIYISMDDEIRMGLFHEDWSVHYPKGPLDPGHALLIMRPVLAEGWADNRKFTYALGEAP